MTEQVLPEPGQFDSVSEWFSYLRAEDIPVPVQVPHAISKASNELGLERPEGGRMAQVAVWDEVRADSVCHPGHDDPSEVKTPTRRTDRWGRRHPGEDSHENLRRVSTSEGCQLTTDQLEPELVRLEKLLTRAAALQVALIVMDRSNCRPYADAERLGLVAHMVIAGEYSFSNQAVVGCGVPHSRRFSPRTDPSQRRRRYEVLLLSRLLCVVTLSESHQMLDDK